MGNTTVYTLVNMEFKANFFLTLEHGGFHVWGKRTRKKRKEKENPSTIGREL